MSEVKRPNVAVLTVNPGVDRTMYFDAPLARGEVNRATVCRLDQGSKGANAAIVLARLGAKVTHFTYTGGPFGPLYESFFAPEGVRLCALSCAAGVRLNVKLSDGEGTFTECNQAGGPVSEAEQAQMLCALGEAEYDCLYLAGSLPKGIPTDFYARCVELARQKGAMTVADCAGDALSRVLESAPDLIKPNRAEFEALVKEGAGLDEKIALFRRRYPNTGMLLSLGGEGAVLVTGEKIYHATAAKVAVKGTVAAGDTLLASFVCEILSGKQAPRALASAAAAAGAKVRLAGTQLPSAAQMAELRDQIRVNEYQKK